MAKYYFDVQDHGSNKDDIGTECASLEEVRRAALRYLPDIAREDMPDGDRRTFSLVVSDESRRPVYAITLSLIGVRLFEPATLQTGSQLP
ncbi:MAG: hypothetical protein JO254_03825 [Pseudolabrys sp.]|nr:hypothetical protein [Pseudolabrys sp.]